MIRQIYVAGPNARAAHNWVGFCIYDPAHPEVYSHVYDLADIGRRESVCHFTASTQKGHENVATKLASGWWERYNAHWDVSEGL